MIFDMTNLFSDRQEVTTTAVSTNTIDLGVSQTPINGIAPLKRDLGAGCAVPLVVQVVADFAGLTDLTVELQVSDAPDSGFTTVASSATVAAADLVAGRSFEPQYIPQGTDKRYVRLNYVVTGTATAGAIVAGITTGHQTN